MFQDVRSAATFMEAWMREQSLPLWATSGFDPEAGRFEEGLTFARERLRQVPIRLLVQARQIFVYALAEARQWHSGSDALVERAYAAMRRDYFRPDGHAGWAFSISRDGSVVDPTRDLYAHAFVLLAVASYVRATGKREGLALAHETLTFLDRDMAAPLGGGYLEVLPAREGARRQNPHMHLFEAMLALWECSGDRLFLDRAEKLFDLFVSRFFQGEQGVLLEYFDAALMPAAGIDAIVEPGHHFEWCWLLRRYEQGTGDGRVPAIVNRLYEHANRNGFDRDRLIVDEVRPDGTTAKASRRLWPMTEAIKCNLAEARRGRTGSLESALELIQAMYDRFLRDAPRGGWIDRFGEDGSRLGDFMPATSLYHLAGAVDEISRFAAAGKI
ncbi:MAG: mannose-6-phosphate isomerase [Reyranella sp.]|uniref:AGE family epimerase/isomerase n=1 Tax=Reyranella sp. TaxID=1929291 RepID=UPI00121642CC|nr:AGE family epimerase/isomerase [Reyranella sp.]TAJ92079.1 MAG: mannose-6-phosphate isomerase [Reyranella sp.]TBR30376.1 MAG: mannose-6-phosphate isomerase [Reyranella sp.]